MARGSKRFGSTAGFGTHRSGGGSAILKDWKKAKQIDVWLSLREPPIAIFRHSVPVVTTYKNKKTKKEEQHVFGKSLTCHETEEVLENQYFREEDGSRKHPPERCSLCKLVEWTWQQIALYEETRDSKKKKGFSLSTPMFTFKGKDDDRSVTLLAGGIAFSKSKWDKLTDEQQGDRDKAKIVVSGGDKELWKSKTYAQSHNMHAKVEYAITVAEHANPEHGLQVAITPQSLGDKVQERINEQLENGVVYEKHPYLLRWKYDEFNKNPSDKYKCSVLDKTKPSPRILRLIKDKPPEADIDKLIEPFDQLTLRAQLERAATPEVKDLIPWDKIFPTREQVKEWREQDEKDAKAADARAKETADEDTGGEEEDDEEEEAPKKKLKKRSAAGKKDEEDEDEDDEDEDEDEDEEEDDEDDEDEEEEDEEDEEDEDEEDEDEDEDKDEKKDDEEDEGEDEDDGTVECDACGKPMPEDASKCPECGASYDEEGNLIKKKKKKASANGTPAGSGGTNKAAKKKPKGDEEEDVPFVRSCDFSSLYPWGDV